MRRLLYSMAGLMCSVAIVAISIAALRFPSDQWLEVICMLTLVVLASGIVGLVCHRGAARAWWLGFTLFGWGYLAVLAFRRCCLHAEWDAFPVATTRLLNHLQEQMSKPSAIGPSGLDPFVPISQFLFALLAGWFGGFIGRFFYGASRGAEASTGILRDDFEAAENGGVGNPTGVTASDCLLRHWHSDGRVS